MYAAAGELKTMAFSGPTESRYPPAVSSEAFKGGSALARKIRLELLLFEATGFCVTRLVDWLRAGSFLLCLYSSWWSVEFKLHLLFAASCSIL